MATKQAAINADILTRPLGEINAAQFLGVLNDVKLTGDIAVLLPDKKKYELWVEEGGLSKIPLGVLIEKLRREKKKLELEKRFLENIKRVGEWEIDPNRFIDPLVRERLVEEIVSEVVRRIGK